MDIKELVERVKLTPEEIQIERYKVENDLYKHTDYDVTEWDTVIVQAQLNKVLNNPNLALIIREGDTVPLGVEIGTHLVILLKEALKEVNND